MSEYNTASFSIESLTERMEAAYKRINYMREAWEAIGVCKERSQAFHLVAELSEKTPHTLHNLTRLETLCEVMCCLNEGKKNSESLNQG